ncbi:MAG: hypothetical protein R3C25_02260 [Hyphomonadaceae bacterium]
MAVGAPVPIRESVGAAMRFVRANWRFIGFVSAIGAAAATLVAGLALAVPQLSLLTGIASAGVQAFVYAALVAAFLFGASAARGRVVTDGMRVWGAMLVVGFFLFLFFLVVTIPVMMVLAAGPMAPYLTDLQSAGADEEAVLGVMTRFMEENPGPVLALTLFYAALWLLLTSRLYLSAPASVDQGRVLTFETWKWTKGATWRIVAARLWLLAPANIFVGALGHLVGRGVGMDTLNPASAAAAVSSNPIGFLAYVAVTSFLTFALYAALEAGLSAYLYRGLKPAAAQT